VQVVSLEERVQVVRAEVHDVVLLLRIADVVVLEPTLVFALMRVTPQQIEHFLMVVDVVLSQLDLKRSLNLLDALDVINSWPDTSVAAEYSLDLIGNDRC